MTKKLPTSRLKATPTSLPDLRQARAAVLDRLADAELQHGHVAAAEQLAHRAAALREMVR